MTDPDALELEGIGDGIRYYERDTQRMTVDGRSAVITFRDREAARRRRVAAPAIREHVEHAS